eukprot:TRINITY_DN56819_c0_g1_i2.p1 TRINITY_DN56819_c0_g1~~TRINITY_DN56819_c0_g1_i2.p1  ORF type:complete len:275 (+),score=41.77 TRINITY_DN56819_c0_g1_i2:37-825(+)
MDLCALLTYGLPLVHSHELEKRAAQCGLDCLAAKIVATATKASSQSEQAVAVKPVQATSDIVSVDKVASAESESADDAKQKMQGVAQKLGIHSARFLSVEADYYTWSLEQRQNRVEANSVDELCKSVVMENTHIGGGGGEAASDPRRVSRILVLVQYVAKLHRDKLHRAIRDMEVARGIPPLGKRQYNFRLIDAEECQRLTGFGHNAVTPLGLDFPVVMSDRIESLPGGCFWLGGGHKDLKLNLSVSDVKNVLGATVADITA